MPVAALLQPRARMSDYVDTFERSLSRIAFQHDAFFDRFYDILIGSNADVAAKFEGVDMERQKRVLRDSLRELAVFFASHTITPDMEKLARIHSRAHLDIAPRLYDIWMDSLVKAAHETDSEFDDRAELAWRLVLSPGIEFMKFHHDRELPT